MSDRRNSDIVLGQLVGEVKSINEKLNTHTSKEETRMDTMEGKLDQLLIKHNTMKVVWSTIKFAGTIGFLVFAGYKGDIKMAWDVFIKGL